MNFLPKEITLGVTKMAQNECDRNKSRALICQPIQKWPIIYLSEMGHFGTGDFHMALNR